MAIEGAIVTAELRELCPDMAAKIEEILSMVEIIAPAAAAEHSEEMERNRALAFETLHSMARRDRGGEGHGAEADEGGACELIGALDRWTRASASAK